MSDDYKYVLRYLPLYKAAIEGDWETAERIIDADEDAATSKITYWWETTLHIAVGTNSSHHFVDQLIARIAAKDVTKLRIPDYMGNNSLHYAAKCGNTRAARLLVERDPEMTQIPNPYGNTALKLAAWYARKDTLWYLLEKTKDVKGDGEAATSPYAGVAGGDLITLSITAGFYDVALYLVENYPNLAIEKDRESCTALQALAKKPQHFRSGSHGWFWQNIIYSLIPINQENAFGYPIKGMKSKYPRASSWRKRPDSEESWFTPVRSKMNLVFWNAFKYLAPFIKNIHDTKVMHLQTRKLSKLVCEKVIEHDDHATAWDVLGQSMSTAAQFGVHEIVEDCLEIYPGVIWYKIEGLYLFLAAIKYRQENVYNLIYQMTGHKVFATTNTYNNENALHLAAKLAPSHRLNTVTGAALQMQRELQWFKEVETIVEPSFKEALNNEKKTPRMLFTDEHAGLVEKGEQWMKDTASSSTVVGALIITMAFAAAFTVPGGNNDQGEPLFLKLNLFMWFIISDAIALFSSSTAVLMFLSILTSRYAEQDFLYALPKRLTIGLLSLFISIATTMIAFSATLALVIRSEVSWIAFPIALLAAVPITLFALLQFPLLVELVNSTYGWPIFHKQNNLLLHSARTDNQNAQGEDFAMQDGINSVGCSLCLSVLSWVFLHQ